MLDLLPALDTALTVILLLYTATKVGAARSQHGVKAPAISGHPDFERAWRVQMNTLEASIMFLPSLWLATEYGGQAWLAGLVGLLWVLSRTWYAIAYQRDAAKRGAPFAMASLFMSALLVWGLVAILIQMANKG